MWRSRPEASGFRPAASKGDGRCRGPFRAVPVWVRMTTAKAAAARARPALIAKPALMPAVNPAGSMSASARSPGHCAVTIAPPDGDAKGQPACPEDGVGGGGHAGLPVRDGGGGSGGDRGGGQSDTHTGQQQPGHHLPGGQPGWMWVSSESGRSGHHAGGNEWP